MSKIDVYEVVTRLIGDVSSVGETHIDNKRKENLIETMDLVERLLTDIQFATRGLECHEHSRKEIGKIADSFLKSITEYYSAEEES